MLEADAALKQRRRLPRTCAGRIHYEVQTAFLNIQAADQSVKVAGSSVKLAQEQLNQAQDRFSAGVASNIEVVQAQQALGARDGQLHLEPVCSQRCQRPVWQRHLELRSLHSSSSCEAFNGRKLEFRK